MLESFFSGLYNSGTDPITLSVFLTLILSALVIGAVQALVYMHNNSGSKSFVVTLAILPAVVSTIIMLVSGSIGAGVAVAGTFSLVRFRSAPGSGKEIAAVFTAMAVGLACGMGCPGLAALFALVMCLADTLYAKIGFGERRGEDLHKCLQVTVPESLEYAEIFDDLFEEYTTEAKMTRVKTTNLGSLNRLTYEVTLRESGIEKQFIDALRCRNGNLEISLSARMEASAEL